MADRRGAWARIDGIARGLAAIAGTLPPSLLAGAALAAHLPLGASDRFAIGLFSVVPLWVAAMTAGFLVRRGWVALLACAVATLVLAAVVPAAVFVPRVP